MKKVELPDFDDMIDLSRKIGETKTALMLATASYDQVKADITQAVISLPQFWTDGKAPSNAHIRDTYHIRGYDDSTKEQLANFVELIAQLTGQLKEYETMFKVYEDMIGVWRTQSANDRYDAS